MVNNRGDPASTPNLIDTTAASGWVGTYIVTSSSFLIEGGIDSTVSVVAIKAEFGYGSAHWWSG